MEHIGEAYSLFRRHPRLWQYVWGPVIATLLVFSLLAYGGYAWLESWDRSRGVDGGLLAAILYFTIAAVLGIWLFLAVVAVISSLVWERLTAEIERLIGSTVSATPIGCGMAVVDTIQRLIFTLLMAIVAIVAGSVIPIIGAPIIAGVVGLFDFTASAFLRRGVTLPGQFSRVFKLKGWASFVLAAGFLTVIPVVNVLSLPLLVAGATIMVVRSSSQEAPAPQW